MSGYKHAALMLQYAEDAAKTDKPWELWEYQYEHESESNWHEIIGNPVWHEKIKYRRKPAKWQPVGGAWWIKGEGDVVEALQSKPAKEFGTERPTKEQAERAAIQMRKFNRLLALRDELCGDDEVDFNNGTFKHYLAYCNSRKKWDVGTTVVTQFCTPFFLTEESAHRACDMLNSGEMEL